MDINDFKEPIPLVVLPFENPQQELLPIPFMGRVKNRKCSNRKEKSVSKNKRKMIKASKKKNRKR
jgi:hypothetical protein